MEKEKSFSETEPFKDGSNNEMRLITKRGNYAAFELLSEDNQEHSGPSEKGRGYITDLRGHSDDGSDTIWPGPIMSWFGPGERYATCEEALEAMEKEENKEK